MGQIENQKQPAKTEPSISQLNESLENHDNSDVARTLKNYFPTETTASARLFDEFSKTHVSDIKKLTGDIKDCQEAAAIDKRSIKNIDDLLLTPLRTDVQAKVRGDVNADLDGDEKALKASPENAVRAARIAALDQAILDLGVFRGVKLTDKQKELITKDRDLKIKDMRNSLEDIPNEMKYIQDNNALIKALRNPEKFAELQEAALSVKSNRIRDIELEGASGANGQPGSGYIGQSEVSIEVDRQLVKEFKFNGNIRNRLR